MAWLTNRWKPVNVWASSSKAVIHWLSSKIPWPSHNALVPRTSRKRTSPSSGILALFVGLLFACDWGVAQEHNDIKPNADEGSAESGTTEANREAEDHSEIADRLVKAGRIGEAISLLDLARDKNQSPGLRSWCLNRLARVDEPIPKEKELFRELAIDPNETTEVRLVCLDKLRRCQDAEITKVFAEFSSSRDLRVLQVVSRGLCRATPSETTTKALLQVCQHCGENPTIKEDLIDALSKSKDPQASGLVFDWLRSKDSDLSDMGVIATQLRITDPTNTDKLVTLLLEKSRSPDVQVRLNAVSTLGSMGAEFVLPSFSRWLADPAEEVATTAISWLGFTVHPKAIDPLLQALNDGRKNVTLGALQILPRYKQERILPEIIAKLKADDPDIRRSAAVALSLLTLNVLGKPNAGSPPEGELVTEHSQWQQWWQQQGERFDFIGRYLHVLEQADAPQRNQLLREFSRGDWPRDERMTRYLQSRLSSPDPAERTFAVTAMFVVAVPDYELVDGLIQSIEELRHTFVFFLFPWLTGEVVPETMVPNESNQKEYQEWASTQIGRWKKWWAEHRDEFKQNERKYQEAFMERLKARYRLPGE